MKKTFLSLYLVAIGFSSLSAMESPVQHIDVDQPTFEFVMHCQAFFQKDENRSSYDHDLSHIGIEYGLNSAKISAGLNSIDSRLARLDFNSPNREVMLSLKSFLCEQKFNIQSGDYFLELGEPFLTGNVKAFNFINKPLSITPTDQKIEDSVSSWHLSILGSPLFKVSCAATGAGIVTYCALRLYNKDKPQEQRYSAIKWSLGAAAVVGVGTYWYVR